MAELTAPMPVMPLQPGFRVQFEAIDPTTGAAVAGVTVSLATIFASEPGVSEDVGAPGPFMLVPGPESVV